MPKARERKEIGRSSNQRLCRPLRFALRELRGGLHGFRIFVACVPTGMNTGVLISPWDVVIFPRRPAVSAPLFVK